MNRPGSKLPGGASFNDPEIMFWVIYNPKVGQLHGPYGPLEMTWNKNGTLDVWGAALKSMPDLPAVNLFRSEGEARKYADLNNLLDRDHWFVLSQVVTSQEDGS